MNNTSRATLATALFAARLAVPATVELSEARTFNLSGSEAEASYAGGDFMMVPAWPTNLTVSITASGATVKCFDSVVNPRIVVGEGVSAQIELSRPAEIVAKASSSVTLCRNGADWNPGCDPTWQAGTGSAPSLWLDPANQTGMVFLQEALNPADTTDTDKPRVHVMWDARNANTTNRLHAVNPRGTSYSQTFPILKADAGNPYLSMPGSRRIAFDDQPVDSTAALKGFTSQFVIMVFGAQLGGGRALVATENGVFRRAGTTLAAPMMETNLIAYLNGERVDPTAQTFSNGWQIVSFETGGECIWGLGHPAKSTSRTAAPDGCGGQNYGDVMMFEDIPSEAERIKIERYLAKKWGLEPYYRGGEPGVEAKVYGTGAVSLGSDAELGGGFSGSVAANGFNVTVAGTALPPDDGVVPADSRLGWWDPSYPGAVSNTSDRVDAIYDRGDFRSVGSYLLGSAADVSSRRPNLAVSARGFGPELPWIDMLTPIGGTMLRVYPSPMTNGKNTFLSAKTVFLVIDSCGGGGTPFLDTAAGDRLSQRLASNEGADQDKPIWGGRGTKTELVFENGDTRLNGREIDGGATGFSGRPELLSASTPASFPFGFVGYYGHNNVAGRGEMVGEVIAYSAELDAAARAGVEAYLMWKWFGEARDGYSAVTNAVVAGARDVRVSRSLLLPKLGGDYRGSVTVDSGNFSFRIVSSEDRCDVEGAFSCGELVVPANCVVNAVSSGNIPSGTVFRLVSWDAATPPSTRWTLCASELLESKRAKLVQAPDGLDLVLAMPTVLSIR